MSDEPKRRSRAWIWIGWALAAALFSYPLSIGPAWWVCNHVDSSAWTLQTYLTVYAPLDWAAKDNETFGHLLMSYLSLWVRPMRSAFAPP
jgi:hypothetical protein